MTIKKFIDRPLLSIVINVMVVAVGIIALTRLPIEKFPDIAPPTVYLWASYPGASAETVQKSVLGAAGTGHQRRGQHDVYDLVGISLLYALTLAPALCAMILKPRKE